MERQSRDQAIITVATCAALSVLPSAAHADAGIPLLACAYPGFWLILPAVIIVEGLLAWAIVRVGVRRALLVAAIANVVSTVAGMPVAWAVSRVLERPAGALANSAHVSTLFERFAGNILLSPGGLSGAHENWQSEVILCWIILIVPFLLLSVLVEWLVASKLLGKQYRKRTALWAWAANVVSYGLTVLFFWRLFVFTWYCIGH